LTHGQSFLKHTNPSSSPITRRAKIKNKNLYIW